MDPRQLENGVDDYIGGYQIATGVAFLVLCTTFVALRFISEACISRTKFGIEDAIIAVAWVLMLGYCANTIVGVTQGGIGRHLAYWMVIDPGILIPYFKILFVEELIYAPTIALLKTSILCLYLRLFSVKRWFRVATYGFIGYIWIWAITLTFIFIFMCHPISKQWNKSLPGTCLDAVTIYKWHSIPNVIHDAGMLFLPLPAVWKLKTSTRNKIGLSFLFVLGTLGCVAGFVRLGLFWEADFFGDATWAAVRLFSWTLAEPGMICICACLPAISALFKHVFEHSVVEKRSAASERSRRRGYNNVHGSNNNYVQIESVPLGSMNALKTEGHILGTRPQATYPPAKGIRMTKDISWSVSQAP